MFVRQLLKPSPARLNFLLLRQAALPRAAFSARSDVPEAEIRPDDGTEDPLADDKAFQDWLSEGIPEQH